MKLEHEKVSVRRKIKNLPAEERRDFLDHLEGPKIKTHKKSILYEQQEQEYKLELQEYLHGKDTL